jgi:hypothetical protein
VNNVSDADGPNWITSSMQVQSVDEASPSIVAAVVNLNSTVIELFFSEPTNQTLVNFTYPGVTFLNYTVLTPTSALLFVNGTIQSLTGKLATQALANNPFNISLFGVYGISSLDLDLDSVQDAFEVRFSSPVSPVNCSRFAPGSSRVSYTNTSVVCTGSRPSYTRGSPPITNADSKFELAPFGNEFVQIDAIRPIVLSYTFLNLTTIVFTFSESFVYLSQSGISFDGLHVISVEVNSPNLTVSFAPRNAGNASFSSCTTLMDATANAGLCNYEFTVLESLSSPPSSSSSSSSSISFASVYGAIIISYSSIGALFVLYPLIPSK